MYIYKAQIIDEENNDIVVEVSGYSEESLEEEMGKKKWTEAIKNYENKINLNDYF